MKKLLPILILLGVLYLAWDIYLAPRTLPHHAILANKDGKKLNVSITNASFNDVSFVSLQDGRSYKLPLNDLSLPSRYKVIRLVRNNNNSVEHKDYSAQEKKDNVYAANLKLFIADNQRKIALMEVELEEATNKGHLAKARQLGTDMEKLRADNARYETRLIALQAGK